MPKTRWRGSAGPGLLIGDAGVDTADAKRWWSVNGDDNSGKKGHPIIRVSPHRGYAAETDVFWRLLTAAIEPCMATPNAYKLC